VLGEGEEVLRRAHGQPRSWMVRIVLAIRLANATGRVQILFAIFPRRRQGQLRACRNFRRCGRLSGPE
jgi:hypothetical protein